MGSLCFPAPGAPRTAGLALRPPSTVPCLRTQPCPGGRQRKREQAPAGGGRAASRTVSSPAGHTGGCRGPSVLSTASLLRGHTSLRDSGRGRFPATPCPVPVCSGKCVLRKTGPPATPASRPRERLAGTRPLRGCLAPPEPMLAAAASRGPPCLPAPVASTLFGESLSPRHLSCLAPHPTPRCWRPPSFPHGAPATAPAPAPLPRLAPCSPRQPMRGPLLDPLQGHGD